MVPITDAGNWTSENGDGAWAHVPDAVTLDLEDGVRPEHKQEARTLIRETISLASRGSAEVFVRINSDNLETDLEASVWPGLTGVVLPKVEHAEEVARVSDMIGRIEGNRGIEGDSLELIVLLESALGVWNVREIIAASPRVTEVALGETGLCRDISIVPTEEYDPFVYARGRIVIEGTAAGVRPVGMAYPLGSLPAITSRDELHRLALVAKNLGFKGVICPDPAWVEPVNAAFTPTPELVDYYTQVREVFAEAVLRDTAAIPFKGRMIDVPVDKWAEIVLEMSAACKARDDEKKRALESIR